MKRLAVAVVALSFSSGIALGALAILADRTAGGIVAVSSALNREGAAATVSTPAGGLARRNFPADSISMGDDSESLSGWVPGSAAVELQLTGVNYQWEVRYWGLPGSVRPFGKQRAGAAQAAREIHLPAESDVRICLQSRDFVYLVTVPNLDGGPSQKSQIAVPNQRFTLDFNTGPQGILELRGDHLCGLPRPSLNLTAVIQSEPEFRAWMDGQRK